MTRGRMTRGGALALFALGMLLASCSFDDDALATSSAPSQESAADPAGDAAEGLSGLVEGSAAPRPAGGGAALVGLAKPLAVIRFERPDVEYQDELLAALGSVLERRPNAGFEVVAVTPRFDAAQSRAAGAEAEEIYRALAAMGLPAERLSLSAATAPQAETREVHLYVR